MAGRNVKAGRVALIIIAILLVIAVIVLRFVDRLPQAWSKQHAARQHVTVPAPNAMATTPYAHTLSSKTTPHPGAAKVMIMLLANRHCPMGCPKVRFGTVHLFLQKPGAPLYYFASLEVGQYAVFHLPAGAYTLYAQLADDDHLRVRPPSGNATVFKAFKNKTVDFVTAKWLLDLKSNQTYPLKIEESRGAFDRQATLSVHALGPDEAIHYVQSQALRKVGSDPYLDDAALKAVRYAGLLAQPEDAKSLLRFRYISCQVPLKTGHEQACHYDFLQESAQHEPVLLSQDASCPAFGTLTKSSDLGWGVQCHFVTGFKAPQAVAASVPPASTQAATPAPQKALPPLPSGEATQPALVAPQTSKQQAEVSTKRPSMPYPQSATPSDALPPQPQPALVLPQQPQQPKQPAQPEQPEQPAHLSTERPSMPYPEAAQSVASTPSEALEAVLASPSVSAQARPKAPQAKAALPKSKVGSPKSKAALPMHLTAPP